MKLFLNKRAIIALSLCAAIATTWIILSSRHGDVSFGTTTKPTQLLNAHASSTRWLSFQGERFEGIQGSKPYYLPITNTDYIFFVTATDRLANYQYHFRSISGHQRWDFPGRDGALGGGIATPTNNFNHDWVDAVRLPKIVIATRLMDEVRKFEFDLDRGTVVEITP